VVITRTGTRVVYENRWMRVREDAIRYDNGAAGIYGVIEKPDFVMVIPIEDDAAWLVEQYRYPIARRVWEFPSGAWEDRPAADPVDVARGELKEETGFTAGHLRRLGYVHEGTGFCTQGYTVFVATDLTPGPPALSPEEQGLRAARFPLADVRRMIRDGEITDAATIASLGLFLLDQG
jgi:ADP-ribose pyrophosphatase